MKNFSSDEYAECCAAVEEFMRAIESTHSGAHRRLGFLEGWLPMQVLESDGLLAAIKRTTADLQQRAANHAREEV